jgi:PIN domain nuclease of toxin-antitoxin system
MRSVVVDTHAVVWHLTKPERLGSAARRVLAAADAGRTLAFVPAIVLAEVALLSERGRIRFSCVQVVSALAERPGWQVLALDVEQALAFATLPGVKDPMDRLIAAAARALDAPVISRDETYDGAGIPRTWD